MALPAELVQRLPAHLLRQGGLPVQASEPAEVLSLGSEQLDQALPDHGLPRGAVVEFSVRGPSALGTTLALAACHSAQQAAEARGGSLPWCAFVDPTGSLYAPGVDAARVALDRLLVVRPPLEALSRVCVRLADARLFSVIVIDTVGVPGRSLQVKLGAWSKVVRKLATAVDKTTSCVVLLTDADMPRALPLPVAQRIELSRPFEERLVVRIVKDKHGRVSLPRPVVWARRGHPEIPAHVRKLA